MWRLPSAAELRWLVYTTLAYGGRGISYFTYWGPESYGGIYRDGQPAPHAKDVAALNAELGGLGPELLQLDSLGVYHTGELPLGTQAIPASAPVQVTGSGELILGLFGRGVAASAFLVVNRSYRSGTEATLKVTLPGARVELLDPATGKWGDGEALPADRKLAVKLAPGNGRLYRVTD